MAHQNLFPVQIENVLSAHPSIREVAALAVPDARLGEVVGAWIVRDPNAMTQLSKEEVRALVAEGMNPQVRISSPFDSHVLRCVRHNVLLPMSRFMSTRAD